MSNMDYFGNRNNRISQMLRSTKDPVSAVLGLEGFNVPWISLFIGGAFWLFAYLDNDTLPAIFQTVFSTSLPF